MKSPFIFAWSFLKLSNTKAFIPQKTHFILFLRFILLYLSLKLISHLLVQQTTSVSQVLLPTFGLMLRLEVRLKISYPKPMIKRSLSMFINKQLIVFFGKPHKHFKSLLTLKEVILARNPLLSV